MNAVQRLWAAFDDRIGFTELLKPILDHPVPRTSNRTGWWYVFGSATLVSFIVAVITGIPLAAEYIPSTGQAYQSIQWITHSAIFGYQIRSIHYFSANLMMVMIFIHMMRVFLMGSYKYPREVNWVLGVLLLFLTAAIVFTGQILRWDQVGVYTIMITVFQAVRTPIIGNWVGNAVLGGNTITGVTVSRFFALHVFVLPGLLFAIIGFHLYMVLRAGISEPPQRGRPVDPQRYRAWYHELLQRDGVPFWPDAAWRDVTFGIGVLILIVVLAITVGPPALAGPPDPSNIQVVPRPDWYFLWYFAALALIPAGLENVMIICGPLFLFLGLLSLPFWANKGERTPTRRPWAVVTAICTGLMIFSLTIIGADSPWSPNFSARPLPASVVGATSGPVADGATLFYTSDCEKCHSVGGYGGTRGPDLTDVGERLSSSDMIIRILNGGDNMPAFASTLTSPQVNDLVAFLQSRTVFKKTCLGCQGQGAATTPSAPSQHWLTWNTSAHTATLTLVANATNALAGFNFDGYGNGQMVVSVPAGYHVTVKFSNQGAIPHSAVVTPFTDRQRISNFPVAFSGASTTNPTSGSTQGQQETFSFVASKAGTYAIVCGVPGHEASGMWDVLKVTTGGQPSFATNGQGQTVTAPSVAASATPASTSTSQRWLSWDTSTHAATLTLVAGATNALAGFNFDGYGNGQMVVSVPAGYHVTVKFSNDSAIPHSAVVTPYADKSKTSNFPLAFPGASTPNPTSGSAKGQTEQFSFVANKTGTYAIVCGVPGHEAAGMWDVLKVTSGGKPSLAVNGTG